jgi:hypothetical protein
MGGGGSGAQPTGGTNGAGEGPVGTGGVDGVAGSGTAGESMGTGGTAVDGSLFDIDVQLASDVDPQAPGTIGIVTWSVDLDGVTQASIEFGLDTDYGMTAPVDLNEADFRTLLLGMKPAQTYHFRIVASTGGMTVASDDQTVDTGPPTDLVDVTFDVVDDANRERGFIVASYWQGPRGPIPFIIDPDGEIVWWYESSSNGIARAVMSADGKNMWMVLASNNGGPIERVSMDTLDGELYSTAISSHDITPVSGDLMAFLEYGESDCDSIFEIDPSGDAREIFETQGVTMGMMCHSNALRYSETEDVYTLSDVSTDVYVVSREGELQWQLSERVSGGNGSWGGVQHGHHLLGNGETMVVFANRFSGMVSAAIEYDLSDGSEIMQYQSGNFSANLGDVQRLPGGTTLVTFSNDAILHEVDAQGNLVLEIHGGGDAMGYALWRESLYGPPPDLGL